MYSEGGCRVTGLEVVVGGGSIYPDPLQWERPFGEGCGGGVTCPLH